MALEPILQSLREHHPKAEVALLQRAFEVAERAHQGQTRRSGDDYITHPLAVTQILAELGHDPADAGGGAAARHGRGHGRTASRTCAATSVTRSPCWSTA
jgi:hypothetical protein